MDFTQKKPLPNPRPSANPLSKLFFVWLMPLLWQGSKQDLTINDLYDVLDDDAAGKLGEKMSKAWEKESEIQKKKGNRPRLYRAMSQIYFLPYAIRVLVLLFSECCLRIGQSVFLYQLITSFEDGGSRQDQYLFGTGIIVCTFFYVLFQHTAFFGLYHLGMLLRVSACSLLYRKALKLSKASDSGQTNVGQLVNIMSNDASRFDQAVLRLHNLFIGPTQMVIVTYLQWTMGGFGITCLAGTGFLLALIPFQYFNATLFGKFRLQMAQRSDKRGQIMNEIIVAMRVIKMYAWEKPFSVVVDKLRKLEVEILRKSSLLKAIYLSLFMSASKLISYFTIFAYLYTQGNLKASNIFFLVTTCNLLRMTIVYSIPNAAAQLGELGVALKRIEDFLLLDEITRNTPAITGLTNPFGGSKEEKFVPRVTLTNVVARWTSKRETLEGISTNFSGDKLIMVIGAVGSGKTSLLHLLISELPILQGSLTLNGRISYASQEPWIFAGSLRRNILFGREFDRERYTQVVEASALQEDLKQLPFGENSIVGERGIALSGGQKARVNLARALYQDADIYLLDDPLSAVDARVSSHIFDRCIQGHLSGKLRILVTHQLQYLPQADHIVVLNRGKILAQGGFQELVDQGVDLYSVVAEEDNEETQGSSAKPKRKDAKAAKSEEKEEGKPEKKEEAMAGGSVTGRTYLDYFRSGGSYFAIVFLGMGFIIAQVTYSLADYWLSYWTDLAEKNNCTGVSPSSTENIYLINYVPEETRTILEENCDPFDFHFYFYVYSGIVAGVFVITQGVALYYFVYCMGISINLHDKMFQCMVRAPTKFFDDNPSGRILNRFMKDIGSMDEQLPPAFYDALTNFFLMIASVALVVVSNYYLVVPAVFLLVGLVLIRRFFVRTARDVKRIEALTRSPLFTHLSATLQGLTTIRSSGSENVLLQQFDGHQDLHSSAWYIFIAANRWFGIWLELVSLLFLTTVTYGFMVLAEFQDFGGGQIGLAISSCLGLNGVFQWGMRQSAETENLMTSVERALEYCKIDSEAPLESKEDSKPSSTWPSEGRILAQNVSFSYGDKDVLRNLSFEVKGKEKIGIVGRTGAGKSSIIAALFRMTEPRGEILIDDVRIKDIGLHDLRRSISIIPQDPVLFSGSIRYNLDPFQSYGDPEIWRAIEEVELKEAISALDFQVADGGSNFSVGQRQLLCLARAILRKNKILIMDEATANVDPRTDSFIQKTIRSKFADCTIITIAHRLHSVMDCDRILVLEQGELMEYDHPHLLLSNTKGYLSSMVEHTGSSASTMLRQVAQEAYEARHHGSSGE